MTSIIIATEHWYRYTRVEIAKMQDCSAYILEHLGAETKIYRGKFYEISRVPRQTKLPNFPVKIVNDKFRGNFAVKSQISG